MRLINYAPVFFSFLLILVKCLAMSLAGNPLFQWCVIPVDVAFSGFAFDVYALGTLSRRQWIWPEAQTWLNEPGSQIVPNKLRSAEVILVGIMFFWHLAIFLVAIKLVPCYSGSIGVTAGILGISIITYMLPILVIEGRVQRICISVL